MRFGIGLQGLYADRERCAALRDEGTALRLGVRDGASLRGGGMALRLGARDGFRN